MKTVPHSLALITCACLLLLSGCASNTAVRDSKQLFAEGRVEEGVLQLERATREFPEDHEVRAEYFRQRDTAANQLLVAADAERAARRTAQAQALYRRVQAFDANNPRAREGLADLVVQQRLEASVQEASKLIDANNATAAERLLRAVVAESPNHSQARAMLSGLRDKAARAEVAAPTLKSSFSKPLTLEFRDTPLKTVFEVMARSSGLNFVLDKDVRSDTKITIFVRDTSMDDLLKLILTTNQLERKVLNENSVLIYPNTPVKAKDYVDLVTRSFYLANADVKQAQALVRLIVKTKDIFMDEKLNLLVIKDTPDAVRLAEQLIASLDIAEPEVMLDVEVLELSRSKLRELGLRFPDQVGYGLLTPSTNSTIVNGSVSQSSTTLGGGLAAGYIDLNNAAGLTAFVANPGLMLNLKNQVGDGNMLANPRIRVKNREKAKIHIGDKLPVFTTTSTANVGVSASVSFLDVGLKLDVEPNVYLDDEVGIKVGLEVSSIVKEISGPAGSQAYQIGTRTAATSLRLKNGETQVLAGLISDEERSSANRLPGLGDIPGLGRLFSSQSDSKNKTEIILLITPHIVRNLAQPQGAGLNVPAGSESSVGYRPALQLQKAEPRALSLSSNPPGGPRDTPPARGREAVPVELPEGVQDIASMHPFDMTPVVVETAPAAPVEAASNAPQAMPPSSVTLQPVAQ
ncbi:secretin N-terminal domain-containing protein [Rhodoferax lacus]|uniref:secretin N-terminal domain-containing protein n=1 Tax=Rhodoferax lacus TaxID=2184758 RepID=UPI001F1C8980|nr:secretin N-terminal domain-containing protein [Rhodoferax lacus]